MRGADALKSGFGRFCCLVSYPAAQADGMQGEVVARRNCKLWLRSAGLYAIVNPDIVGRTPMAVAYIEARPKGRGEHAPSKGDPTVQLGARPGQTRERQIWCGLGQCRLCSCPAFRGPGNRCEDCGHHYDEHTTSLGLRGRQSRKPSSTGHGADDVGVNQCPLTYWARG
jgi:hypothetical protein